MVLHGVCDNQTLSIMGQHCPVVQHLDITGDCLGQRLIFMVMASVTVTVTVMVTINIFVITRFS